MLAPRARPSAQATFVAARCAPTNPTRPHHARVALNLSRQARARWMPVCRRQSVPCRCVPPRVTRGIFFPGIICSTLLSVLYGQKGSVAARIWWLLRCLKIWLLLGGATPESQRARGTGSSLLSRSHLLSNAYTSGSGCRGLQHVHAPRHDLGIARLLMQSHAICHKH